MTRVYALAAALIAALLLSSVAVAGGGSLVTSYGGQGQQALVKTSTASKGRGEGEQWDERRESEWNTAVHRARPWLAVRGWNGPRAHGRRAAPQRAQQVLS